VVIATCIRLFGEDPHFTSYQVAAKRIGETGIRLRFEIDEPVDPLLRNGRFDGGLGPSGGGGTGSCAVWEYVHVQESDAVGDGDGLLEVVL
jgi:hypothetical protein